jgi:nitrogen fixation protein FixH
MTARTETPFRLTGWHVLAMLSAFFGVMIAVNVLFVVLALKTHPGEIAPRAYVQGLKFNDAIAQRDASIARGWRLGAALYATPNGAAVVVKLRDRAGDPVRGADVSATLRRPVASDADHTLHFVEIAPGDYRADVGPLSQGQWLFEGAAQTAQGRVVADARLMWR